MAYEEKDDAPADKKGGADILAQAKDCFTACQANESQNRAAALDDIKFARLGEQWDQRIKNQRERDGRPALTVNKMPAYIRQVVNDARQNKPSIKVRPVDSGADRQTADILTGLIRNIEQTSKADIAYDTAAESAVSGGFGYIKVDLDYAYDDTFDKDIKICPVPDPLTVYGDPNSTGADSADWMEAFEIVPMSVDKFTLDYPGKEKVSWDSETALTEKDNEITLAIYWKREEVEKDLLLLTDGQTMLADKMDEPIEEGGPTHAEVLQLKGVTIKQKRKTRSYKVTRYVLSGKDVLETEEWAGKYIPIIPVYGDIINVEGERHLQSLIRHAKEAQQQYNFQRTAEVEMISLQSKVPWLVKKGSVDEDPNWETANQVAHPYLEWTGDQPPQRLMLDMATGAASMQAARSANDDMKAIIGIYDASLGQRSNETSGKAILARQREGDVSTYHFIDNLSRGVRHCGCIVLDLIPHVYTGPRIVRVLGEDGDVKTVPVNQPHVMGEQGPMPAPPDATPDQFAGVFDITAGKYDLAVEAGPSYTTRRVEAAEQMTEMFRAMPDAAPLLGDIWAKMQDWPMADKIEQRLAEARRAQGGPSPEEKKMQAQMQMEGQKLQMQAQADQQKAQSDLAIEQQKMELERQKAAMEMQLAREQAEAEMEIERMKAGMQLQLQTQKTQADIQTKQQTAEHAASLKEKGMEQKHQAAMSLNLGENVGQTIAETMSAAMARAGDIMAEKLSGVTLKVQMPRMKRTPVRDRHGNIMHAIDEPMPDEQGMMQ
jgi:hypothetical protein